MNTQNVQPVQSANVGTQPNLPPAQEPSFTNTDPADFTFALDEQSGQMMLVPKTATTAQQSDVSQEDVRFQQATEVAQTQHPVEPNPLEERLGKVEGLMTQMAQFLQGIVQGQGLNNLKQEQPQEETIDLSDGIDGNTLVKLIQTTVEKVLNSKLAPIEATMSETRLRNEYNDSAMKFGKEFIELTPAMVEIKRSDPNLSWEIIFKAMQMARNIPNGKSTNLDSTTQTGNGSVQNGKPQPAQALVQKAQQLATESGGQPRTLVDESQKITTIDAAFNKALTQLGLR